MSHRHKELPFKKGDTVVIKVVRFPAGRRWRYTTRKITRINRTENIGVLGESSVRVLPDLTVEGCNEHGVLRSVEIPTTELRQMVERHSIIEEIDILLDSDCVSPEDLVEIRDTLERKVSDGRSKAAQDTRN